MSDQSIPLPLPLPEILQQWLIFNTKFHVLLCHTTGCQHAIAPGSISRHLRDKHQVKSEVYKQADQYIKQWQWQYNFQNVPLPQDRSLPQPVLPVFNGFQCVSCNFKTQSRKVMRKHGSKEHNQKGLKDEEIYIVIRLQTWFTAKRARYWVVDEDATRQARDINNNNRGGSGSGSSSNDTGAAIKAEIEEWIKQEEGQYQVNTVATDIDPWLQYMGWEEILAGSKHDLVTTAAFTATATATEPELERVLESWERILQRSLTTLAAVSNFKDILKWWASPKNEVASQKPFELPQNYKKTIPRYSQTFARLLCYIIRTAPESIEEKTETGVVFSELQLEQVQHIREAVAVADNDNELDVAVMRLIINLLAQDTSQLLLYESPVMHYLAVRGVDTQMKTFYPSFRYTPILAHMIWMIRLLILEMAVSEQGWPEIGLESRKEIGAVAGAVAERIHEVRKRHLCEGSFSPASSILSQLAFGQAQNRVQSSEANIYWSDDRQTVFYDGKGAAMAKVRIMCQELTVELEELLHKLLFHQSVKPVPLPQLVDSMGTAQRFQQKGYSFMDHPDNARWKVSWEFLWERMLQDRQILVKSNGSSSRDGQLIWADQPCTVYLAKEKQFL